jgi:hypothetical protein
MKGDATNISRRRQEPMMMIGQSIVLAALVDIASKSRISSAIDSTSAVRIGSLAFEM